jgi:nucleoid-associated protein YgaU
MAMRRYARSPVLRGGAHYGTSQGSRAIRSAIDRGSIRFDVFVTSRGDRLDAIAGRVYGDARLWWIIAAASGVGWGLQVPPGTRLRIPRDLSEVSEVAG